MEPTGTVTVGAALALFNNNQYQPNLFSLEPSWNSQRDCKTHHRNNILTRRTELDPVSPPPILIFIVIRRNQPAPQLHQRPRTQAVEPLPALLEPSLIHQPIHDALRLRHGQRLRRPSLSLLRSRAARLPTVRISGRGLCELHRLHRRDHHCLGPSRVIGVEHGVQDALHKRDLIRGVCRRELRERVAGRVDEGVDAVCSTAIPVSSFRQLVQGASDLEVEWGDGGVCGGDVGGEVGLRDVFGEDCAALCFQQSACRFGKLSQVIEDGTVD